MEHSIIRTRPNVAVATLTLLALLPGTLHAQDIAGLKLDRGFLSAIPASGKQCEIVRTIIALAHTLGLTVVAEGIETEEQWTAVQGLNCDLIQGFHFARPLDAEQATRYLARELARGKAA